MNIQCKKPRTEKEIKTIFTDFLNKTKFNIPSVYPLCKKYHKYLHFIISNFECPVDDTLRYEFLLEKLAYESYGIHASKSAFGNLDERKVFFRAAIANSSFNKKKLISSYADYIWRFEGVTDELVEMSIGAEKSLTMEQMPNIFWLVYIASLYEIGNIKKALELLIRYIRIYGLTGIHERFLLSRFAAEHGLDDPQIIMAAKACYILDESLHNDTLAKLVTGKRVAVVGNAPTEIGNQKGAEIDSHDVVIRFNRYITEGFESDYGTKTTCWTRGFPKPGRMIDRTLKESFKLVVYAADHLHTPMVNELIENNICRNNEEGQMVCSFKPEDTISFRNTSKVVFPTIGTLMLWMLHGLKDKISELNIYGFSFQEKDNAAGKKPWYFVPDGDNSKPYLQNNIHSSHEREYLKTIFSDYLR